MSDRRSSSVWVAAWILGLGCSDDGLPVEDPRVDGSVTVEDVGFASDAGLLADAGDFADASGSTADAGPRFDAVPCTFQIPPGHVEGETALCGEVDVPERRTPTTGSVTIAFLLLRGTEPTLHPDPVVMLPGGPGLYAERLVESLTPARIDELGWGRDIIVVEQRGVGRSSPNLDCAALESGSSRALLDCRQSYEGAGVDLDAYNSIESAADVEDLRRALGYDRINLWGSSYGSRLALHVLRDHGAGIRSVLLGSPLPPDTKFYASILPAYDQALRRVFAACAAQETCRRHAPDLPSTLTRMVAELDANPATTEVRSPSGQLLARFPVSGATFLFFLFDLLYLEEWVARVPQIIENAARRDLALLGEGLASLPRFRSGGFSFGLHYSVQCGEEIPYTSQSDIDAVVSDLLPEVRSTLGGIYQGTRQVCFSWPVASVDPRVREPIRSDVPVLVVSGLYDPAISRASVEALGAGLARGQSVTIAHGAHDPLDSGPCADEIARSFLEDPLSAVDASCAEQPMTFSFE